MCVRVLFVLFVNLYLGLTVIIYCTVVIIKIWHGDAYKLPNQREVVNGQWYDVIKLNVFGKFECLTIEIYGMIIARLNLFNCTALNNSYAVL